MKPPKSFSSTDSATALWPENSSLDTVSWMPKNHPTTRKDPTKPSGHASKLRRGHPKGTKKMKTCGMLDQAIMCQVIIFLNLKQYGYYDLWFMTSSLRFSMLSSAVLRCHLEEKFQSSVPATRDLKGFRRHAVPLPHKQRPVLQSTNPHQIPDDKHRLYSVVSRPNGVPRWYLHVGEGFLHSGALMNAMQVNFPDWPM